MQADVEKGWWLSSATTRSPNPQGQLPTSYILGLHYYCWLPGDHLLRVSRVSTCQTLPVPYYEWCLSIKVVIGIYVCTSNRDVCRDPKHDIFMEYSRIHVRNIWDDISKFWTPSLVSNNRTPYSNSRPANLCTESSKEQNISAVFTPWATDYLSSVYLHLEQ